MSWERGEIQGWDTGHGARSEQTSSRAPEPWSIYLFITDKTSQGIKLLQTSTRGCFRCFQLVQSISGRLKGCSRSRHCNLQKWTFNDSNAEKLMCTAEAEQVETCNKTAQVKVVCDRWDVTAGLCKRVFKSTIVTYCEELYVTLRF